MLLVGFVFMPDHVHLLVYPTLPNPQIDLYLAAFKQPFSREIKQILRAQRSPLLDELMVRERPGKECFRLWQEGGGYDRNLNTPRSIQSSLDYMHLNPVRRGLCARAVDWKWSSARFYLCEPPVHDPDLPMIHGIPIGALD
jgi:putative transposase